MNQEIKPGILRFVSILSLMFEKGIKKKKIAPGVWRLLSILFFNNWKRNKQKNCTRNFKSRKYTFFKNWERNEQKDCTRNFKVRKYDFFNNSKGISKKIAPRFSRFVSMLFWYLKNRWAKKLRQESEDW